jgi:hypothetical protein
VRLERSQCARSSNYQFHVHVHVVSNPVLQPIRLSLPLRNNLLRLLPPLVPERDKHPKPRRHLHKAPCKHNAVVQRHIARAHHVVVAARGHHTAFLEHVCVSGQGEEEEKPDGRLYTPVLVRELFGHGYGGQICQADESEEDGEEGYRGGGLEEFAGSRLR